MNRPSIATAEIRSVVLDRTWMHTKAVVTAVSSWGVEVKFEVPEHRMNSYVVGRMVQVGIKLLPPEKRGG